MGRKGGNKSKKLWGESETENEGGDEEERRGDGMDQEVYTASKGNRCHCECLLYDVQSFKCKPEDKRSVQNFSRRNVQLI